MTDYCMQGEYPADLPGRSWALQIAQARGVGHDSWCSRLRQNQQRRHAASSCRQSGVAVVHAYPMFEHTTRERKRRATYHLEDEPLTCVRSIHDQHICPQKLKFRYLPASSWELRRRKETLRPYAQRMWIVRQNLAPWKVRDWTVVSATHEYDLLCRPKPANLTFPCIHLGCKGSAMYHCYLADPFERGPSFASFLREFWRCACMNTAVVFAGL